MIIHTVDHTSDTRDLPTTRVYEFEGNKLYAVREDPYGFWKLSLERGSLPSPLKNQQFTSFLEAEKHIQNYLRSRGKEILKKII